MRPIQSGDYFTGRLDRKTMSVVGIDPERGDLTEAAYYYQFPIMERHLENPAVSSELKEQFRFLLDYWAEESTYTACRRAFDRDVDEGLPSDEYYLAEEISYPMYGLGGPYLDFEKLVTYGVSGLRAATQDRFIINVLVVGLLFQAASHLHNLLLSQHSFAQHSKKVYILV